MSLYYLYAEFLGFFFHKNFLFSSSSRKVKSHVRKGYIWTRLVYCYWIKTKEQRRNLRLYDAN